MSLLPMGDEHLHCRREWLWMEAEATRLRAELQNERKDLHALKDECRRSREMNVELARALDMQSCSCGWEYGCRLCDARRVALAKYEKYQQGQ